ncbi:MAG: hypothetical protein GY812_15030 [Actinomycetia bacterium]|nr:hypothetical protein [Actinomycetes bacterium]
MPDELWGTESAPQRYRCTACGNLTRFDVAATTRTRAFHHYDISGDLSVEDEQVLQRRIESVSCRWCGNGDSVVELDADASPDGTGADDAAPPEEG